MYLDSIIRIKNAGARRKERVKMPYSRFDLEVLESLANLGYVDSVTRKGRGVKRIIEVKLKYKEDGSSSISGLKFISHPSRRVFSGYRGLKSSHQGYGSYLLSTPEGVMTEKEAKRKKVGGQILFEIW
ncbi:MAG: 30S ribosomal protein S8 [Candidatus Colwellbacteria bacterium]|nr:30S ribosomal protein S8 [Candidatus Colwellbacteria bacterium]